MSVLPFFSTSLVEIVFPAIDSLRFFVHLKDIIGWFSNILDKSLFTFKMC